MLSCTTILNILTDGATESWIFSPYNPTDNYLFIVKINLTWNTVPNSKQRHPHYVHILHSCQNEDENAVLILRKESSVLKINQRNTCKIIHFILFICRTNNSKINTSKLRNIVYLKYFNNSRVCETNSVYNQYCLLKRLYIRIQKRNSSLACFCGRGVMMGKGLEHPTSHVDDNAKCCCTTLMTKSWSDSSWINENIKRLNEILENP